MSAESLSPIFTPASPDIAGIVSWLHIGDLHMTTESVQNHHDLRAIVAEINEAFKDSLSFVFLPGDIAEDGNPEAYSVVRRTLDELQVPWCAIVGDHDVHERSFASFLRMMSQHTYYAFTVGMTRFLALNAFDIADPGSFTVLPEQLAWCELELRRATEEKLAKVFLLHCYPSELKAGGERLMELITRYGVRLVDMGHTHYNELANDGKTLYSATRSTGQIEEGRVGFSVTNLDGENVSWRFVELGALPVTIITTPSDVRLQTDEMKARNVEGGPLLIRAKIWSAKTMTKVRARFGAAEGEMQRIEASAVWQVTLEVGPLVPGLYALTVQGIDADGETTDDTIQVRVGEVSMKIAREVRDLENALEAWQEHGLLGTQLGPNKNGRKW